MLPDFRWISTQNGLIKDLLKNIKFHIKTMTLFLKQNKTKPTHKQKPKQTLLRGFITMRDRNVIRSACRQH